MIKYVLEAKKFIAAAAGVVGILVSTGLLSGQTEHWVTVAIGAVTALLVYFVPNSPNSKPSA